MENKEKKYCPFKYVQYSLHETVCCEEKCQVWSEIRKTCGLKVTTCGVKVTD
jgi:hypothetical protein